MGGVCRGYFVGEYFVGGVFVMWGFISGVYSIFDILAEDK